MKSVDLDRHVAAIAAGLRARAVLAVFDGKLTPRNRMYMDACRVVDDVIGAAIIFTRDAGHHTSGWMKNPDFERCEHLSISPEPPRIIIPGRQRTELNKETERALLRAFWGDDLPKTWVESAKTTSGRRVGVKHWRMFCNEAWEPIMPRGEVYSTDLTESGWRSQSQVEEEERRRIISPLTPG